MLQVQCVPPPRMPATGARESNLQAARTELALALDCALAAYTFDASLGDAVDVFVTKLRREGQSVEAAIDAVGASVRVNQPADKLSGDDAGERKWRAYLAVYDMVIQRAIRTFVIGSIEEEAICVLHAVDGDTRHRGDSSPTRLSERSAAARDGAARFGSVHQMEFPMGKMRRDG